MFGKRRKKAQNITRRGVVVIFGTDAEEVVFVTATVNSRGEESVTAGFFVEPFGSDSVDQAVTQAMEYLQARRVDEITVVEGLQSVRRAFCDCCGRLGHAQVE